MAKIKKMNVQDTEVAVSFGSKEKDFISLTDMTKNFGGSKVIENWMRSRSTIEFLGVWEQLNNPNFNSPDFEGIRNEAGGHTFILSVKQWVKKTNAVGIKAKAGKYHSGTFAHRDIAFEFGSWLDPKFKLYLIKEFQRLKEEEARNKSLGWDLHRELTRTNYKIHTGAIARNIVPPLLSKEEKSEIYSDEADMLNHVLFGMRARQWRKEHPKEAKQKLNIRDFATVEELIVLSNLESINAQLLDEGLDIGDRMDRLRKIAHVQMKTMLSNSKSKSMKNIKKMKPGEMETKEDFNQIMLNTRQPDHS